MQNIEIQHEHRMKLKFKSTALGAALVLSAFTASLSPASAQIAQTTLGTVTNLPATVAAASQTNTTSYVDIHNNSGLALSWKFNVSAGTSNAVLWVYPSVDKTNYDSVPWQLIRSAAGTTDQVATTNWSAQQLRGYTSLRIGALTNQNAGTLTNKGIVFSRPNS
jgi:hypothetical protein